MKTSLVSGIWSENRVSLSCLVLSLCQVGGLTPAESANYLNSRKDRLDNKSYHVLGNALNLPHLVGAVQSLYLPDPWGR